MMKRSFSKSHKDGSAVLPAGQGQSWKAPGPTAGSSVCSSTAVTLCSTGQAQICGSQSHAGAAGIKQMGPNLRDRLCLSACIVMTLFQSHLFTQPIAGPGECSPVISWGAAALLWWILRVNNRK